VGRAVRFYGSSPIGSTVRRPSSVQRPLHGKHFEAAQQTTALEKVVREQASSERKGPRGRAGQQKERRERRQGKRENEGEEGRCERREGEEAGEKSRDREKKKGSRERKKGEVGIGEENIDRVKRKLRKQERDGCRTGRRIEFR